MERVNRTLRDGLKKNKTSNLKERLEEVTCFYNNTGHRGIGMTPTDALKSGDKPKVSEQAQKYKQEFINDYNRRYAIGDKVLIRNEIKHNKIDTDLIQLGKLLTRLDIINI